MQNKNALTRWVFILLSVFIITLILWNTYAFFNQLKENERIKMHLWAEAQTELNQPNLDGINIEMISQIIQTNTTTPMILYSLAEDTYDVRNIDEPKVDSIIQRKNREELAEQFAAEYKPIEIKYNDEILQTVYYGNSPLITKLKYYPATLILIIFLFFTALYFFYKTSKSAEQNKLWAGMAKETAHQIGTPLSSLVGWIEILRSENVNPEYIIEMEKDIYRLETITERFSKIGSIPNLEKKDIVSETKDAFDYLKHRTSKLIEFELDIPETPIYVNLNSQLYSWTIENLVKNGIDAMKGKGKITIDIEKNHKCVFIRISDTGKGMPKRNFKKIFNPGYTTKKRGWGLGLSLAKRIIEEYHNGRIHVLKSNVKTGTIFEISLRLDKLV